MHIAEDVTVVAVPVLQFSNVLTDDNLVYIIQNTDDVEKEKSISQRESVSEIVSSALIDKKHEPVIVTLLRNKGAQVSENSYEKIIKSFSDKQVVMERLVQRPKVPINIVRIASEKLVPSNQNETEKCEHDYEFNHFAKKALANGVKREMLPIFALCKGSIHFFELAVARQICVPVVNIRKLLENDDNCEKFDIIYERVKLPSNLHDAARVLYLVLKEFTEGNIDSEKGELKESDAKRMVNNMIMLAEEMGDVENMEYLVSLIKGGIK